MIRKIHAWEYQKRYDNMSAIERSAYESRVGEWLRGSAPMLMNKIDGFDARLQNVVTVSTGWNIRECQAFEEGVLLLSSLVSGGETWLPDMLYTKTARRSIKRMWSVLTEVQSESVGAAMVSQHTGERGQRPKEEPAEGTGKATRVVGGKGPFRGQRGGGLQGEGAGKQGTVGGNPSGKPTGTDATGGTRGGNPSGKPTGTDATGGTRGTDVPVRPTHIDQYAHLLPKKTQERAANYGPLMRELDEMREKERLLMDAEGVSAKDREAVAKRIVAIDKEIGGIKKELDAEWEKLVKAGRVVVDDLGMAHIVSSLQNDKARGNGDVLSRELTSEQKDRRRSVRKWLVDTRHGNSSEASIKEHAAKWVEYFKEYLTLEGEKAFEDDAILKGAEHYGVDVEELKSK